MITSFFRLILFRLTAIDRYRSGGANYVRFTLVLNYTLARDNALRRSGATYGCLSVEAFAQLALC